MTSKLLKEFWCPKHWEKYRRHKIRVYAADVEKSVPTRGEADQIFVRVN